VDSFLGKNTSLPRKIGRRQASRPGVVFAIWGLSLPLMAVAEVMIDHFKSDQAVAEAAAA
jgi:hypothetical protein